MYYGGEWLRSYHPSKLYGDILVENLDRMLGVPVFVRDGSLGGCLGLAGLGILNERKALYGPVLYDMRVNKCAGL